MRRGGCGNPHKCSKKAREYVRKLGEKWNPEAREVNRGPQPGERELMSGENVKALELDLTTKGSIKEGFRVFTRARNTQTHQTNYERIPQLPPDLMTIYTDGLCIKNEEGQAVAGAGVWFGPEDPRNTTTRLPEHIPQTNNAGEAVAVLIATQTAPQAQAILIKSDSQITIDSLTTYLREREDGGWIGMANREILKSIVATVRKRGGITLMEKVKGHAGIRGNEEADRLANEGARKTTPDNIRTEIPEGYDIPGAKLVKLTQAVAYRGIIERYPVPDRKGTTAHLDATRWAAKERVGEFPTDKQIWLSLRDKDLSKQVRNFLWRAMHNAYKIGKYWENIKDYEHRAECPRCRVTETLEHILTECEASGQETIWRFVRDLCEKRGLPFQKPSLGDQLGCAITRIARKGDKGERRFMKIVYSEATYTTWIIRCEWRISRKSDPENTPTEKEILCRIKAAITKRIKLDCLATDSERFGKKAYEPRIIKDTWSNLIPEDLAPLRLWRKLTVVLVGIG